MSGFFQHPWGHFIHFKIMWKSEQSHVWVFEQTSSVWRRLIELMLMLNVTFLKTLKYENSKVDQTWSAPSCRNRMFFYSFHQFFSSSSVGVWWFGLICGSSVFFSGFTDRCWSVLNSCMNVSSASLRVWKNPEKSQRWLDSCRLLVYVPTAGKCGPNPMFCPCDLYPTC